jgi:hypothetical protein
MSLFRALSGVSRINHLYIVEVSLKHTLICTWMSVVIGVFITRILGWVFTDSGQLIYQCQFGSHHASAI